MARGKNISTDEPLFQPFQEGLALIRGGERVEPIRESREGADRLIGPRPLAGQVGYALGVPRGEVGRLLFGPRIGDGKLLF
jgi:hypothetical protein